MKKPLLLLFIFLIAVISVIFFVAQSVTTKVNTSLAVVSKKSKINVNIGGEPFALHPGLCQSIDFSTPVLHMLFDGLTRLNKEGIPELSVAKEVSISSNYTRYLFQLKETVWSNGTPLTADDFVYSWRKILEPTSVSPSADQLYVIKNAKQVKLGLTASENLGVKAIGPYTLEVCLEHSTPYFLDLTAMPFYFPICSETDKTTPNWAFQSGNTFICNGPYTLSKWKHSDYIEVIRNPDYWDKEKVNLDSITVTMLEENTALAMFQNGELDWAGSPTSTILPEALNGLKNQKNLFITPSSGTHYYFFNTNITPFNNKNIRKAFTYAINRKSIVLNLTQGEQLPANTLVPPDLWLTTPNHFSETKENLALHYFQEGLKELQINAEQFPKITLIYSDWERNEKIAQVVQQQWKRTLGVNVSLQSLERKLFLERRNSHSYQIASGSWYCTYKDPLSFLSLFDPQEENSPTTWIDSTYSELLTKVKESVNFEERMNLLIKAEQHLLEEAPLIPIYHNTFAFVKNPKLKDVYLSDLGILDFKHAYLEKN
jgi:oligopeptide transport system substrate-binding protein